MFCLWMYHLPYLRTDSMYWVLYWGDAILTYREHVSTGLSAGFFANVFPSLLPSGILVECNGVQVSTRRTISQRPLPAYNQMFCRTLFCSAVFVPDIVPVH